MHNILWDWFKIDTYRVLKHGKRWLVINRIFDVAGKQREFILTSMWLGVGKEVGFPLPKVPSYCSHQINLGFFCIGWSEVKE